ncbi:hypothetical protein IscW_ISCW011666, partial [Ixodes scapularis]
CAAPFPLPPASSSTNINTYRCTQQHQTKQRMKNKAQSHGGRRRHAQLKTIQSKQTKSKKKKRKVKKFREGDEPKDETKMALKTMRQNV